MQSLYSEFHTVLLLCVQDKTVHGPELLRIQDQLSVSDNLVDT